MSSTLSASVLASVKVQARLVQLGVKSATGVSFSFGPPPPLSSPPHAARTRESAAT
jgi:hypothetical protein